MSMQQLQQDISEWHDRNFGPWPDWMAALVVSEEAGEVSRAVLKRKTGHRGTYEEWTAELRKEIGDVIIGLAYLASIEGFDLEQAIQDRWAVIQQRDWNSDPIGHGMPEEA